MVVLVTGGIGSGKSEVCDILNREYQWPVYCADSQVKKLYSTCPDILMRIEDILEEKFTDENGELVASRLARRIFSDKQALMAVEEVVFPYLIEDFNSWKEAFKDNEHIVIESATLLSKPQLRSLPDKVVFVDASLDVRCDRVMKRSGFSKEDVLKRIANQGMMNGGVSDEVSTYVDYVLHNDLSLDELRKKVADLVKNIG